MAKKKTKQQVNIVKIRNVRYYQARDPKGRILAQTKVKQADKTKRQTLANARETFGKYGTFQKGEFFQKKKLSKDGTYFQSYNLKTPSKDEKLSSVGVSLDKFYDKPSDKGRSFSMYQCQGTFRGTHVVATSNKVRPGYSRSRAVKDARTRFFKKIGYIVEHNNDTGSDGSESLGRKQESQIKDYMEGWVSYAENLKGY